MTKTLPQLAVAHDERIAARSIRFFYGDRAFATVVAKVVIRLVEGDGAILLPPEPLVAADEHYENDPSRSVRKACEIAPRLLATDVILGGSAFQPAGTQGTTRVVGLGMHRGDGPIFYKSLYVYGDRTADAPERVRPFSAMPIVWERAFGGLAIEANPVGIDPTAPSVRAFPNLVDPRGPTVPAGFGPIARYWPQRARLLGNTARKNVEGASLELPEGFSFAYFHAAPQDQRVRFLSGDEWLVLDGMHPLAPRVEARLPGMRVLARIHDPSGSSTPVQMMLDMLVIEADRAVASLVFRGMTDAAIEGSAFSVTLDVRGSALVWPDARSAIAPEAPPPPAPAELGVTKDLHGTNPMDAVAQQRASSIAAAPYPLPQPRSGAIADLPGAPWGRTAEPVTSAQGIHVTTPLRLEDAPPEIRVMLGVASSQEPLIRPPSEPPPPPPPVSFRGVALEAPVSVEAPVSSVPELETGIRRIVLEKVHAGEALFGESLAGADLSGLDLSKAILADADLSGANLTGAALGGARLARAKLVAADLSRAKLDGADLSGANLSRARLVDASLEEADLADANATLIVAEGASFARARLERTKLLQASLEKAVLEGARARDADLSGATLDHVRGESIDLSGARLGDARLTNANLTGANLEGADATGASLRDAILDDAVGRVGFERATLDGARFARARFAKSSFRRASLADVRAEEVDLEGADLSMVTAERGAMPRANLANADLRQARMNGADLCGAVLDGAQAQKLQGAELKLQGASLANASFRFARLKGAGLAGAKLAKTDFRDADLSGADLEGVARDGGIWAGAKT